MADEVKDLKKEGKKEVKKSPGSKKLYKGIVRFVKEVRSELKRVIWPSPSQLRNNTVTVIAYCIIIGGIIWLADLGLKQLTEIVFNY